MKEFLEYLVKNFVDNPDKVSVVTEEGADNFIVLTVSVDSLDMGKVIGKNGKIIKAIRELVKVVALKENRKVNVVLAG